MKSIIRLIFKALSVTGYYGSLLCRNAYQSGWRAGIWLDRTLVRRT